MLLRFEPHDAAALYATDALSDDRRRSFEAHAVGCRRCRTDVEYLGEVATAFALVLEPVDPPMSLRGRILAAVRSPAS